MQFTPNSALKSRPTVIFLLLSALMLLTRFHHFGDNLHLPDASWAVFFLAGLWLRKWHFFAFYCAQTVIIDALAVQAGTSSFCVTPAYLFLLPTYAALWSAGRFSQSRKLHEKLLLCAASTALAYAISSFSFHAFSGYFASLSFADYLQNTIQYLAHYEMITLAYCGILLGATSLYGRVNSSAITKQKAF